MHQTPYVPATPWQRSLLLKGDIQASLLVYIPGTLSNCPFVPPLWFAHRPVKTKKNGRGYKKKNPPPETAELFTFSFAMDGEDTTNWRNPNFFFVSAQFVA